MAEIDPARDDEHVDASGNVQRKSRVSVRPVEALLGRNGWNWLRTGITKSTRCTVWVIPNDGFRCRVSGAVTQNGQRHNRFRVWRPQSAVVTYREPPALTFTRSVIPTRCTFEVSIHGVRRQHQQWAGPRIAPWPRVGEIRSRRPTVTFRFVRSYPARYGPRTQTGVGPGAASESVRFRRSGKHSSPPRADFTSNLRILEQYIRHRPESGCFQVWVVPSDPVADLRCAW